MMSVLAVLPLASAGSYSAGRPVTLPPPPPCVGVVVGSYNLNFGLSGDPDTVAAALSLDADVLLLQEVDPDWVEALADSFGPSLPYQLFLPDARGAGGLAVLSRWPLRQHAFVGSPVGWFPGWAVHAETPQGGLQLLDVHLKPPVADTGGFVVGAFTTGDDRLAELEAYLEVLDPGLPTVIAGDFNERAGPSVRLLEDLGYAEALPDEDTWRWPTPVLTLRNRLDHIFVGPGLVAEDGEVLEAGRSDHLPVRARVCGA